MVTHVAVLDDYHGLASSHFSKLDPSQYSIQYFPATLRPYHDAVTSQAEKDELVRRLEPFQVIGKDTLDYHTLQILLTPYLSDHARKNAFP
jgi:hypothetical protein